MKWIVTYSFLFVCIILNAQDEKYIFNKIDSLNVKAQNSLEKSDFATAFNYFNESLKLSDSIHDDYGSAVSNYSIGKIYQHMRDYKEAEKFLKRSIKESQTINDNYLLANTYLSLSEIKSESNSTNEAFNYLKSAFESASKNEVLDEDNNDKREFMLCKTNLSLANAYLDKNYLGEAHVLLLRAKNNLKHNLNHNDLRANFQFTYGKYLFKKSSFNLANIRFNEAIKILEQEVKTKSLEDYKLLSIIYKSLSDSYFELEKEKEAYAALIKHNEIKDKFFNEERIKLENIAQSKFKIADLKNAATTARKQMELQRAVSQKIKQISIVSVLATLVLFVLMLILFRNFRSNIKLNNILKDKNEQLQSAKIEIENTSALKTKFISNITHELRTPLYGVVGLSSLLLEGNNLSKRDSKYLESIKYSGNYLLELVNDVLQMGKIESNTIELKSVSMHLKTTLKRIIASFENRLQETNNKIKLTIDDTIPKYVECDQVRLTQILVNLIGNSIKFTQNGNINLRVQHFKTKNKKVKLKFEVEDNGAGISKKDQQKIFQNFTQVSAESNINYQGTGLGLPIAQKLVELFGGKIELESALGKGSIFSFIINVERSTIEENSNGDKSDESTKYITGNGNCNILVVEDNKINQIVTKNLLQKENFDCKVVSNGVEALEILSKHSFDLILMDINMPVMGGNETTKRIRENDLNIPIIALTAADIEEVKKDYKAIGYNDIITKPFDNYKFFQVITTRIQESKLKQNNKAYDMAAIA